MPPAAREEMEYIGAVWGRNAEDRTFVEELGRRLNALRCYDQCFCEADFRPNSQRPVRAAKRRSSQM